MIFIIVIKCVVNCIPFYTLPVLSEVMFLCFSNIKDKKQIKEKEILVLRTKLTIYLDANLIPSNRTLGPPNQPLILSMFPFRQGTPLLSCMLHILAPLMALLSCSRVILPYPKHVGSVCGPLFIFLQRERTQTPESLRLESTYEGLN